MSKPRSRSPFVSDGRCEVSSFPELTEIIKQPKYKMSTGERVIASTKRPDGTMRKEIRVRAGYTPPDEVGRYVSPKVAAFEQFSKVWYNSLQEVVPDWNGGAATSKSAKKNEKRKLKKQAEKHLGDWNRKTGEAIQDADFVAEKVLDFPAESVVVSAPSIAVAKPVSAPIAPTKAAAPSKIVASSTNPAPIIPSTETPADEELLKKQKTIQKKIRQIDQLKEKLKEGATLNADQLDKISKEQELHSMLAALNLSKR